MRSVSEKIGIKKGMSALLINAPQNFLEEINAPELELKSRLSGEFDYLHLFVVSQKQFHEKFPKLKKYLKLGGSLWVSWPKGGQKETDLTLTKVIELGYDYGLVESKSIRIDDTWSALKFTHPKKGKVYNNSYGKLKSPY